MLGRLVFLQKHVDQLVASGRVFHKQKARGGSVYVEDLEPMGGVGKVGKGAKDVFFVHAGGKKSRHGGHGVVHVVAGAYVCLYHVLFSIDA